jgi:hypothetical protein
VGPYKSDFVIPFALNLTALIEGFYNTSSMNPDTVTVELHNVNSPYALIESKKGMLGSNGNGIFYFSKAVEGTNYYIAVKHRNSLETWSAAGNSFSSSVLSYDFTPSQSLAYGSNLVLKGSKYCIYSGDVTHDGTVDLSDLIVVDNDASAFSSGYIDSDVTGDGTVDLSDLIITDNNASAFVGKIVPSGALIETKIRRSSYYSGKRN